MKSVRLDYPLGLLRLHPLINRLRVVFNGTKLALWRIAGLKTEIVFAVGPVDTDAGGIS